MVTAMDDIGFDYRELFAGEILKYNKYDMEYAVTHNLDITEGTIERLNEYNNSLHVVKLLIRVYWGKIQYIIDNPDTIISFLKERNPQLFEVNGAEQYITEQIKKIGYALVEYIQPSAKVKVKLDKRAIKYAEKKNKK